MNVVPDVLPDLRPSLDVHVVASNTKGKLRRTQKKNVTVEPGTFLLPQQASLSPRTLLVERVFINIEFQTLEPPRLYANVFHADTRLYTMLLVDPGALIVPRHLAPW